MRALLDNFAVVDDHHLIGIADGAQPVGDHKAGAALHQAQQRCWMRASVRVSTLLVASSRIKIAGSARIARAIASSWRWPWLRLLARSERLRLVALRQLADKVIGVGHLAPPG